MSSIFFIFFVFYAWLPQVIDNNDDFICKITSLKHMKREKKD